MSDDVGRLETDPLFLGLTRPAMVFGVTYAWFTLEGMLVATYFIQTSSFWAFLIAAGIHLVGVAICTIEPRFMDILAVWGKTFPKCVNKRFHGNASSYDLY